MDETYIELGKPRDWPEPQPCDQCGRLSKVQGQRETEGKPGSLQYTILCPECGYRTIKPTAAI